MNKRRFLLISTLVMIAVIFVIVGALIYPTAKEIINLNDRIQIEKTTVESRYFQRQKVRSTIERLAEVKAGLPTLRQSVIERGTEITLVEAIEKTANANGLTQNLKLIPPQEGGPSDYSRKLAVDITISGSPRSMGKFISDLGKIEPTLVVTDVNFGKDQKSGVVSASITGWVSWPDAMPTK
jgi:Tfp pilus assembly protein PilO